jgi:putative cardiolipin synthase
MNFDQRSQHINTEIGLIIGSAEIAQQTALRFENMVKPENCYALALTGGGVVGKQHLTWRTEENSQVLEYHREPARSDWQRLQAKFLSLLPLAREL